VAASGARTAAGDAVIGITTSPDAIADLLRAFRQGLKDTGHLEGENVAIEYRWAG
jgi:hypothetical protein